VEEGGGAKARPSTPMNTGRGHLPKTGWAENLKRKSVLKAKREKRIATHGATKVLETQIKGIPSRKGVGKIINPTLGEEGQSPEKRRGGGGS